jgi:hypothetical protein
VSIQGQGDNAPKAVELEIIEEDYSDIVVKGSWVPMGKS